MTKSQVQLDSLGDWWDNLGLYEWLSPGSNSSKEDKLNHQVQNSDFTWINIITAKGRFLHA